MVITVVVALIVTGAVLVPIIGGLSDNDGGNGSGGSGGGEGTTGTVYTLDEYYGQTYPDWPYKSYQVYSPAVQGSSPFNITTSDIIGILDNMREMGIESGFRISVAEVFCDNIVIHGIIVVDEYTGGVLQYSFSYQVMDKTTTVNSVYQGQVFDTYTAQNQMQGKQGSFDFVCSSSGAYTLNVTYYDFDMSSMQSKTNSGQAEFISFLSENENGYYNASMVQYGVSEVPVFDGQKYIMILATLSQTSVSTQYLNAEMTPDTSNATFTITATGDGHTYTASGQLIQLDSYNGIILQYDSLSVEPSDQMVRLYEVFISTQGTVEGGGESGGSSDNDGLGTTGTIMAVIPVFVILAILMYAVTYLRKPEDY